MVENSRLKLQNFVLVCFLAALVFYLLVVGQSILLPLVIAIVFWYLINLLSDLFGKISVAGGPLSRTSRYILSFSTFIIIIWALVELIALNIGGVVRDRKSVV